MGFSYDPDRAAAPEDITIDDAHIILSGSAGGGIIASESRLFRIHGGVIEGVGEFGFKSILRRARGIVHEGFEIVGVTMRNVAAGGVFTSGSDLYGPSRLVGNRFRNVPEPYFTFGKGVDPSQFEMADNTDEP